jgi:hypothetical protein
VRVLTLIACISFKVSILPGNLWIIPLHFSSVPLWLRPWFPWGKIYLCWWWQYKQDCGAKKRYFNNWRTENVNVHTTDTSILLLEMILWLVWHSEDRATWCIHIMKAKEMHNFSDLFDKVLYMFRTGPLSIIRSISTLYICNRYLSCLVLICYMFWRYMINLAWITLSLGVFTAHKHLWNNKHLYVPKFGKTT